MQYTLYHKNIPVVQFSSDEKINEITSIDKIIAPRHIPLYLHFNGETPVKNPDENRKYAMLDPLCRWIDDRCVSSSRMRIKESLRILGLSDTAELAMKAYKLNLSDHYWIAPSELSLDWHKINFFENDFSKEIGLLLFDRIKPKNKNPNSHSPDCVTPGELPKKWEIRDGKRFLIKGGLGSEQQEPVNEVLATEIYSRLGIPHTKYELEIVNEQYYCVCECFASTEIESVSAHDIYAELPAPFDGPLDYKKFLERCEKIGIHNADLDMGNMFLVDYIIANTDRHTNNFAWLRNSDTLEWIGMTPVYDSERSMFRKFAPFEITEHMHTASSLIEAKPFGLTQAEQIKLIPLEKIGRTIDLTLLNDIPTWFRNYLEPLRRISTEKKDALSQILSERIDEAKKIMRTRILEVDEHVKSLESSAKSIEHGVDVDAVLKEFAEKKQAPVQSKSKNDGSHPGK